MAIDGCDPTKTIWLDESDETHEIATAIGDDQVDGRLTVGGAETIEAVATNSRFDDGIVLITENGMLDERLE
jgi:hypothetical protein